MQYEWLVVSRDRSKIRMLDIDRERRLSSPQAKGTRCVVSGIPKGYSATEVAHLSRFGETRSYGYLNKTQRLLR